MSSRNALLLVRRVSSGNYESDGGNLWIALLFLLVESGSVTSVVAKGLYSFCPELLSDYDSIIIIRCWPPRVVTLIWEKSNNELWNQRGFQKLPCNIYFITSLMLANHWNLRWLLTFSLLKQFSISQLGELTKTAIRSVACFVFRQSSGDGWLRTKQATDKIAAFVSSAQQLQYV